MQEIAQGRLACTTSMRGSIYSAAPSPTCPLTGQRTTRGRTCANARIPTKARLLHIHTTPKYPATRNPPPNPHTPQTEVAEPTPPTTLVTSRSGTAFGSAPRQGTGDMNNPQTNEKATLGAPRDIAVSWILIRLADYTLRLAALASQLKPRRFPAHGFPAHG